MLLLTQLLIPIRGQQVNYEVLLTQDMLLFKPADHGSRYEMPFGIFTRAQDGWTVRDDLDKGLELQFQEQIKSLNIR